MDGEQIECNNKIRCSNAINSLIEIGGLWNGGEILLHVHENQDVTPGIYVFQFGSQRWANIWKTAPNLEVYYVGGGSTFGSGQIVITEINPHYIKGNFEFTARRQIVISTEMKIVRNGEFHIKRDR